MADKRKIKADIDKNGEGVDNAIERYKRREKNLFPLRINRQTVIYVIKEKCTQQYTDWYRQNRIR